MNKTLISREWISRLPVLLLSLLVLFCAGACGGDDKPAMTMEQAMGVAPRTASSAPATKKGRALEVDHGFKSNRSWDRISQHFFQFGKNIESEIRTGTLEWKFRDIFRNNYETFFPPPAETPVVLSTGEQPRQEEKKSAVMGFLDALKKAGERPLELESLDSEDNDVASVTDPLLLRPLQDYSFRVIMTGVANPQAMVLDPQGNTYMVRVNDRIGNEGGFITDILKQEVLVKLPEQDTPVVLSLAPPEIPEQMRMGY